jgi:hypothetical protein
VVLPDPLGAENINKFPIFYSYEPCVSINKPLCAERRQCRGRGKKFFRRAATCGNTEKNFSAAPQPAGTEKKVFPLHRNPREQRKKFFRCTATRGNREKSFSAVPQPAGTRKKVFPLRCNLRGQKKSFFRPADTAGSAAKSF